MNKTNDNAHHTNPNSTITKLVKATKMYTPLLSGFLHAKLNEVSTLSRYTEVMEEYNFSLHDIIRIADLAIALED